MFYAHFSLDHYLLLTPFLPTLWFSFYLFLGRL